MLTLLAAAALAATSIQAPPLGDRPPVTGPRTQILTLGSAHLSEMTTVQPPMLGPLIDRLARFRPTIITVEGVSGEQCDMLRRAAKYQEAWNDYCADPAPAQKISGLTQQQAEAESEATFDRWNASGASPPSASDRRRQALLLLAAGERGSAWVQWLRLAPADRIAADGLDSDMVKILNRDGRKLNENYNIAAVLAARLGLDRIHAVDDHTSDGALLHAGKAYGDAMQARWARMRKDPRFLDYDRRAKAVVDGSSMIAFYRYLNDPARVSAQVRADFGGALADPRVAPYGRQYSAWWDVRNLRMAANVRAATVEHPGARVLNIVGASHKPWYDAWMRQMPDVDVVPSAPYLR